MEKKLLPSTSMLLAFDASAQFESFTQAARKLHLTQGAVSRQVAALEAQLGICLFDRQGKTIKLTKVGKSYAEDVNAILNDIRNASINTMTYGRSGTLNLSILPTFATKWLIPRLPNFLSKHSDITINFINKLEPFDLHSENIHAAIHFGTPNWPNTHAVFLMNEQVIAVCSQEYYATHQPQSIKDLADLTLLYLSTRPDAWKNLFIAHNQKPCHFQSMLQFEQFSIMTQAAAVGLGIALVPQFLIQNELARKELVQIFPTIDLPQNEIHQPAYYLVSPKQKQNYIPLQLFRQWLIDSISQ